MMKSVVWILTVGFFVAVATLSAQEAVESVPVSTNLVAAELWAGMHTAGMIDDAQYQHVLENGHLPIATTVKNSPIPVDRQAGWFNLADHNVVTPDELVAILYKGSMPNMTDAEYQAFVDLAPVYQPARSKRLTYNLRRKHIDV